ncbi:hypothetical protein Tco_0497889 [Tanacetum coccineum]
MDTTRAEQIALDDALVAPANQLKVGKSNFRLSSDLKSKEATLQVVYDVLKLTPFYNAFQILVINKCLSGKSTGYDSLRLSQAQILWGMYHKKNVDYAYLLWEDFVYQVENKNVKKSNEMYYPHFTKLYGAILPNELTNEDIRNSESNKEYYAIASEAEPPKTKSSVKKKQVGSDKTTTPPKGKRLKTSAKTAKPAKKKQPAKTSMDKGLIVLSEVALTEAEQLKLVIEKSKTQTHSSHASGSGADVRNW